MWRALPRANPGVSPMMVSASRAAVSVSAGRPAYRRRWPRIVSARASVGDGGRRRSRVTARSAIDTRRAGGGRTSSQNRRARHMCTRARILVSTSASVDGRRRVDRLRARPGTVKNGRVPVRPHLYRDDALILRVQKLGESDRIITMLTRRHGRIRAAAKGVRRTTSRFGARLEPFGHVDVQLAGDLGNHARTLHTIRQAESIELYGKQLGRDYPRYTAASAVVETAERLTPIEQEPSLRLFQLTLG